MRPAGLLLLLAAALLPLALPLVVAPATSDVPSIQVAPLGHAENLRLPAVAVAMPAPTSLLPCGLHAHEGAAPQDAARLLLRPPPAIDACRLL